MWHICVVEWTTRPGLYVRSQVPSRMRRSYHGCSRSARPRSSSGIDGRDENSIWAVVSLYHISAEMFVFARNKFRRRKRRGGVVANGTPICRQHAFFLPLSTPVVFAHRGRGGGGRNAESTLCSSDIGVELPLSLTLSGDFKDSKL